MSIKSKSAGGRSVLPSVAEILSQQDDPAVLVAVTKAEKLLNDLEKGRREVAQWTAADPGGVPSEIKLKAEGLDAAVRALKEAEDRLSQERGDTISQPHSTVTGSQSSVNSTAAPKVHSRKPSRDVLSPVIEKVQSCCTNPNDTAEVWGHMLALANAKHPPLLRTEDDGIEYLFQEGVKTFSRDALDKRLHRKTKVAPRVKTI